MVIFCTGRFLLGYFSDWLFLFHIQYLFWSPFRLIQDSWSSGLFVFLIFLLLTESQFFFFFFFLISCLQKSFYVGLTLGLSATPPGSEHRMKHDPYECQPKEAWDTMRRCRAPGTRSPLSNLHTPQNSSSWMGFSLYLLPVHYQPLMSKNIRGNNSLNCNSLVLGLEEDMGKPLP